MEYNEFAKRYFDGELSTAEEQSLRERLISTDDAVLTAEERAAKTLLHYASLQSDSSVRINLHPSHPRSRSRFVDALAALCSLRSVRIASAAVLGLFAITLAIHLSQPTVYGYHNGKPITSFDEAQLLAQDIFDNLAHEEFAESHDLQKLFTLD